jgi:hypothetical protein
MKTSGKSLKIKRKMTGKNPDNPSQSRNHGKKVADPTQGLLRAMTPGEKGLGTTYTLSFFLL